ncbi:unnamed protein product [Candidula unifasciata]|uniref:Cytochrome P450 n=1 Tax=Candidula unifasciata TaxID=100452 RepID=A0A8S4A248_9EUPU|nr:unnamed protein product [Candidula unifasciata]
MSCGGWLSLLETTLTTSWTICLLLATFVATVFYWYQNLHKDDWSLYGIKCPRIPGNVFLEINFKHSLANWLKQYGETFGLQSGSKLILVTANLDLWRHILIKDFSNFIDREPKIISSSPFISSLFFARGSEWRKHRQILSPTFTTGKLKYISKSVQKSAQDLTDYLEKQAKSGSLVLIKDVCGRYTSEIIAKTAFGLDAKFVGEENAEFYEYSKNMIDFKNRRGLSKFIANTLQRIPYVGQMSTEVFKLQYFDPVNLVSNKYFDVILKSTIQERKLQQKNGVDRTHSDLLDLLLKANEEAAAGNLEKSEELECIEKGNDRETSVHKLGDEEMLGHSMLLIFAGMETTATTLQMCLYELAANPDVQERVFQEIARVVKHDLPTLEELHDLTYIQQVVDETLRLYPPVASAKRIALETKTYNGVTIPKGTTVVLPYFYTLKDPRMFQDPETFNPSRFSPEEKDKRDPLAFSAFGHGPRICLGMRLAYLELKQGLTQIIRRLRVVLNDKTEPKKGSHRMSFREHNLLVPETPVALLFELREANQ